MAGKGEILPLTGIRGFAALWVLVFHAEREGLCHSFPGLWSVKPFQQVVGLGFLGVDLFFLLSGFVLAWTYAESLSTFDARGYLRYLGARLARIYPLHAAVLALLAIAVVGGALGAWTSPWSGADYLPADFVRHVLLVHSWGFGSWLSWNLPAWSISAEWFAYLWFPFLCGSLTRARRPLVLLVLAFAALAGVALAVPPLSARATLNVPQIGGLIRVTGEFLAGCLLCRAYLLLRDRRIPWGALSWAAALGVAGLAATGRADPWALPCFAVLVLSLAASQGGLARLLSTRAAQLGGRISYAVYMIHCLVFTVVTDAVGSPPPPGSAAAYLWAAGLFIGPVVVGWAAWRFIEEPARHVVRRRVDAALPA